MEQARTIVARSGSGQQIGWQFNLMLGTRLVLIIMSAINIQAHLNASCSQRCKRMRGNSQSLVAATHKQTAKQIHVILFGDTPPDGEVVGRLAQYLLNLPIYIFRLMAGHTKPPHAKLGRSCRASFPAENLLTLDLRVRRRYTKQSRDFIWNKIITSDTQ